MTRRTPIGLAVTVVTAVWMLPGVAWANHLDCARAWPGTPTEATQAWAACKDQDAREHLQMLREERQRASEELERAHQRGMEERRIRALEDAAQAEREKAQAEQDKAQAIRDAAREANRPRTCTTTRNRYYPYGVTTVCE